MTTQTETSSAPQSRKSDRRRKVAAILAGGLVLGVGAAVTLAVYEVAAFGDTCEEGDAPTGTPLVPSRAATATGTVPAFNLTAAATPVNLCFVVTAGAIPQDATGTVTWEFAGTSGAAL